MTAAPPSFRSGSAPCDIVLVGGGHTHVQVLTAFADGAVPEVRLTLVSRDDLTPYSGMLPGHVAGLYRRDEIHIDLRALAAQTGTRFVRATVGGLDRAGRRVLLEDGEPLPYDIVSLDVGIRPDLRMIEGADRWITPVKPIDRFLDRLDRLFAEVEQPGGPRRLAVVGGGPAGVEIALALAARMRRAGAAAGSNQVVLVTAGNVAPSLSAGFRRRIRAALGRAGVTVVSGFRVAAAGPEGLRAVDGRTVAADAVLAATLAKAPDFLADLGLPVRDDGSVLTDRTLRSLGDERVFAVGDCAAVADDPREKAGVYAVRQGPVLARNLSAVARGEPLADWSAQSTHLVLVATGDGRAIGGRGRWPTVEGRWVFRWKDRLDRSFMRRFQAP